MELKYVIFNGVFPVIFPCCISHDEMKKLKIAGIEKAEITSAGFVSIDTVFLSASAYGSSLSLNLKSKPDQDSFILSNLLKNTKRS